MHKIHLNPYKPSINPLLLLSLTFLLHISPVSPKVQCTALYGVWPNQIRSVSTGFETATLISNDPGSGVTKHIFYNFTQGGGTMYTLDNTIVRGMPLFAELKGSINLNSNAYIISDGTTITVEQSNFTVFSYSATIAAANKIRTTFADTTNNFYTMIEATGSFTINYCTKSSGLYSCIQILYFSAQIFHKMIYRNKLLYIYSQSQSISSGMLRIYWTPAHSLKKSLPIPFPTLLSTTFDVNDQYLIITVNTAAKVYNMSSNYSLLSSWTINGTMVSDAKMLNYTVIVEVDGWAQQYCIFSGFFLGQGFFADSYGSYIGLVEGASRFVTWAIGASDYYFYNYTETYNCLISNGCTCIPYYCHDLSGMECVFCGIPASTPVPAPAVINSTSCFINASTYCQIYCIDSCQTCSQQQDKCDSCSKYYIFDTDSCTLSPKMQALATLLGFLNIFRLRNAQVLYFFVGNLQLYNYHRTNYNGVVKEVFDFMDFVQEKLWILVAQDQFMDWSAQPFFLPSYNAYTNPTFLQIERRDSLFFQNTKTFITIYIPVVLLIFCLLNRLFYLLYNYKISVLLRLYSIWLYLVVLIVNQNANIITFLAIQDFKNMFSLSYHVYISKFITVVFYGLVFVLAIAVFPLSCYLYKGLSKYFLSNTYRIRYSFLLTSIRFTAKPLLQSIIHQIFYNQPITQLFFLLTINLLILFIIVAYELKFGIFVVKMLFVFQCMYEFNMILLNLFIYLKYYEQQAPVQLFEQCLVFVMNVFIAISVGTGLWAIFYLLKANKEEFSKEIKDKQIIVQPIKDRKTKNPKKQKSKPKQVIKQLPVIQCKPTHYTHILRVKIITRKIAQQRKPNNRLKLTLKK